MQVAEILSDLTSLRVCDHHDALALVTVNERIPQTTDQHNLKTTNATPSVSGVNSGSYENEDLRRAKELVDLHYEFKARHALGTVDEELSRAREETTGSTVGSLELGLESMATSVDAKLLKQTKFPPEFSRKVDMTKVNIEVMKKWIAGKISEILGNEDDVVIELCFNLLEGSRFPDIKSLQIQLTGFLDKDTGKFCKELWSLCLSAQENPQGVPKELLEAKKLELIQEKIEAERAAEETRKQKEQERARERELEDLRRRERSERTRGGRRGGGRGGRDFDRRRSPPRQRSRDRFRGPPGRREFDSYVPSSSRRGLPKRRRSIERYAPVARRRRNTSSVSVPSDKRKRMADEDEDAAKRSPPPAEKPSSSDHEMKDATEVARVRISSSELREKLLREKIIAMRRTASSDKVGSSTSSR
ncbi:PWI domain-containing protein [Aspergillus vadensis CBS 113365]|uniref:PWI domain-containing protein n=1 Tax=Aspergillus vadensis (strain CBS 113365 / IMI 142717 / IBT 24658) TaxID=1448311 RepID=A0A319B9G7_ASPVC|nr:hypothetical protein BO88DRAFT_341046 [Aspergillus vadensis CBS 113365]PYH69019.1 hypothetical protein BO88DRAFT_341046 [Aspergillus vadensis CBS 113365]